MTIDGAGSDRPVGEEHLPYCETLTETPSIEEAKIRAGVGRMHLDDDALLILHHRIRTKSRPFADHCEARCL